MNVARPPLPRRFGFPLGAVVVATACNALLDNRPREFEPLAGAGVGGNEASGGTLGAAGAAGSSLGGAAGGSVAGAAGETAASTTDAVTTSTTSGATSTTGSATSTTDGATSTTGSATSTGPCAGIECVPETQSAPEPCACDSGRSSTRSCTESCTWGPATGCELGCGNAPSSLPSSTTYIHIWTTAIGRSGTSNCCPQVGESYEATNPQFVWCRSWGGLVSDDSGNYNHWWLWTELDSPSVGAWISAYYLDGQGNDEANGVPDCP